MSDLVAHHWRRYGHHRVYLKTASGVQVGWVDCIRGTSQLEVPAFAVEFAQAVSRLIPAVHVPVDRLVSTGPPPARPVLRDAPRTGEDVAANRPGARAAVREREERAAAPISSRLARLFDARTPERSWRLGRVGEEAVAARLARLPSQWRVLHAIEVGASGSDIDHLVVGPGGVFTINAKHHPDAAVWVGGDCFLINGQRRPYVRNSRYEAKRVAGILGAHSGSPISVIGVIAVMGARRGFTIRQQPTDGMVHVVARRDLDGWLRRRSPVMNDSEVATIYGISRRAEIWRAGAAH